MTCLTDLVLPEAAFNSLTGPANDRVAQCVESAVLAIEPMRRSGERRRETRYPYPYPLQITPVAANGSADPNETFVVIGKHLAPHGIDFYSRQPVSYRRVIVSLDCGVEGWIGLLVELTWCRFGRHGWYDNGGRFLGAAASPILEA
jgi:hypothetical protein